MFREGLISELISNAKFEKASLLISAAVTGNSFEIMVGGFSN